MARARHRGGRPRKARVTLRKPYGGDHGPQTQAARHNTVMVAIDGPNHMAYLQRVDALDRIIQRGLLSMRQQQAAEEIRTAYLRNQMLSSGGELKEQVDASPKPDAVIAAQVDASSRLVRAMQAVPRTSRAVVEHVCWYGLPFRSLGEKEKRRCAQKFYASLTLAADHLGY